MEGDWDRVKAQIAQMLDSRVTPLEQELEQQRALIGQLTKAIQLLSESLTASPSQTLAKPAMKAKPKQHPPTSSAGKATNNNANES
ncbi:unnamed protein product [Blepharisma stoltei]|uniref:Uncharacterized protein n=1 Tax=Blepharisma stoltei TaxID=1481888 RepID=A0AAU9IRQ1_9CILI|nr:unnamed protein product [Blepharisma stoltei]